MVASGLSWVVKRGSWNRGWKVAGDTFILGTIKFVWHETSRIRILVQF